MESKAMTAQDVADYLLAKVDVEGGDSITNLKLQKLLYYAQGFHLAMHAGEPFFEDKILAWKHGPVVRSVWRRYSKHKWRSIDPPTHYHADKLPPEDQEILDAVYNVYGQFPASKLESMTHEEPPWCETDRNRVISVALMTSYFSTLVEAARKGKQVPERPRWPIDSFRFQGRKEISASMAQYRDRLRARH